MDIKGFGRLKCKKYENRQFLFSFSMLSTLLYLFKNNALDVPSE